MKSNQIFKALKKSSVILSAIALLFAGCQTDTPDDNNGTGGGNSQTAIQSVNISGTNTIAATGTTTLTATVTPSSLTGVTYEWKITSGGNYATLSSTASKSVTLTGKNETTTDQNVIVTVTATYNSKKVTSSGFTVKVKGTGTTVEPDTLDSIELEPGTAISLLAGETKDLKATAFYTGDTVPTFSWSITSGADYGSLESTTGRAAASVLKTNTFTAGTVTESQTVKVTVTASLNGDTKSGEFTITVQPKITSVTIATASGSDNIIEATGTTTLEATVAPSSLTGVTYKWEITSGGDYAALSESTTSSVTLTGKNETTTAQTVTVKVTATLGDSSAENTFEVKVASPQTAVEENTLDSISLSPGATLSVTSGKTQDLKATAFYTGNTEPTFAWEITSGSEYGSLTSTGSRSVSISETNTFTAGTVTTAQTVEVTVTASLNGKSESGEFTITVQPAIPETTTSKALFPAHESTAAFKDTQLVLAFEDTPTLTADTKISIYDRSNNLIEEIAINSTEADSFEKLQSGYWYNRGNSQKVRVDGNLVYIQPSTSSLSYATSYYVVIPNGAITGTLLGETAAFDGFTANEWSFTTKSEPSISSTITVSNAIDGTNTADFFSVYGAMCAAAANKSGTYEIQIASGIYYELISVKSQGATLILKGMDGGAVIQYVNNNYLASRMRSSDSDKPSDAGYKGMAQRASFSYTGSDLILENVTIKNLTERKTSYSKTGTYYDTNIGVSESNAQAEAFFFSGSNVVTAYGCSFIGKQDTIYTEGKAWFYNCHIEGDVDFIWGSSDVALFEECEIVCIYDSNSNGTSYIFETRVGSEGDEKIGKGYVLYNSTVTVESGGKVYYGRRASAKGSSGNHHDQAAIVNVDFYTAPESTLWYVGNEPFSLTGTKYGDYADVGWKDFNVTVNGTAADTSGRTSFAGTITQAQYAAEYSGRRAILNRFYNTTDKAYERDTTTNFDVDALINERGYSVTTDNSSEIVSGEAVKVTVTWDFTTGGVTASTSQDFASTVTQLQSNTGYLKGTSDSVLAYVVASSGKLAIRASDAQFNSGTIICVPVVSEGDVVEVTAYPGSYYQSVTLAGTAMTAQTNTYTATADDVTTGYVQIAATGNTYLNSFSVTTTTGTSGDTGSGDSGSGDTGDSGTEVLGTIKVTDIPTGWAGYTGTTDLSGSTVTAPTNYGGNGQSSVTVTTRDALITAAKAGNKVIYVSGIIDMTGGMLPESGTTSTTALDSFIATTTSNAVSSYDDWKTQYAANITADANEDTSNTTVALRSTLQAAWKKQIQLVIGSNTTIIGLDSNSGIRGGTISIAGVENVVLRNLHLQDSFDPFPENQKNDGLNAEWDCVVIDASKYVWIDHCTFEDTICNTDDDFDHVTVKSTSSSATADKELKWQTYDGLLDVKKASDFVTISYCKFQNHDKTSIIGHDKDQTSDENHLTVTLSNNYYLNCTQRLPRVRFGHIHAYNNYYTTDGTGRSNSYIFGLGKNAHIYAEANYFDSTIARAANYPSSLETGGVIYAVDNNSFPNKDSVTLLSTADWTPSTYYTYTALTADAAKTTAETHAGAGVWTVEQ